MINEILVYIGSAFIIFWGIAHIFPVKGVIQSFGDISEDNKKILLLEWLAEAIALCFIGILAIVTVVFSNPFTLITQLVLWISSGALFILGIVTIATAARTSQIPYKLCPVIFSVTITLFIVGSLI